MTRRLPLLAAILAALLLAPAGEAIAATKPMRMTVVVTKDGKRDRSAGGFDICVSRRTRPALSDLRHCARVRSGSARLGEMAGTGSWRVVARRNRRVAAVMKGRHQAFPDLTLTLFWDVPFQ